jgi:ubiquinone/menaquinone biosynthesis C-methylase UbiE
MDKDMANTQFQLEGNAPQQYEQDTVSSWGRPLAELTFEHVSLHRGDRVLDVACGTGIITRVAAQRFRNIGSIVGIDLNAGMLDVARENTPTTGVPVEWRQGDVCVLPLPDGHVHVVLCQQGFQFVPDKLAAFCEIRRVLVPGGRLVFTVWSEVPPYYVALADALTCHVSAETATSCLSPFSWRDAGAIRQVLNDAEFRPIDIQMLEVMRRMPSSAESVLELIARSPFGRDVEAVSEATRMAIGQEVSAALQAYRDGNDFVIPCRTHLVQAQTP